MKMEASRRAMTWVAAIVVAMGLISAASASANDKFKDPKRDGQPGCGHKHAPACADASHDITLVTQGFTNDGLLKHTVKFRGKAKFMPILSIATSSGSKCTVTALSASGGTAVGCSVGDAPGGAAKIVKTNKHIFKYTFEKGAIGDPSWYKWKFSFQGSGKFFDETKKFKHRL